MKIKVYGCRGSMPVTRAKSAEYGGNTSCVLVEVPGQLLIVDAGSGIVELGYEMKEPNYPKDMLKDIGILISHLHMDHILGLAFFKPIFDTAVNTSIYTCSRDERTLKTQVFGMFAPPYWPLALDENVKTQLIEIFDGKTFEIGKLTITPFIASHSDITLSFKITHGGKTLLYLLDNEIPCMDKPLYETLVNHCRGADLVVFDGAYTSEDYASGKRGWGHSTVEDGFKLASDSGCKTMLFSHFSPQYSDEDLNKTADYLKSQAGKTRFLMAKDGLELTI
jgi:ribonuclease BN (tRNA processing enzyme)